MLIMVLYDCYEAFLDFFVWITWCRMWCKICDPTRIFVQKTSDDTPDFLWKISDPSQEITRPSQSEFLNRPLYNVWMIPKAIWPEYIFP
jgi:hypothetical protein